MSPFERLLVALVHGDVRFFTVGGVACAMAGHVRATDDVDILIERNPENIARLARVLSAWGEGAGGVLTVADLPDEPGALRILEEFSLDVFVRLAGLSYADLAASASSQPVSADATPVPFLGPEGLIRVKDGSLRERDQDDVRALREILRDRQP